MKRQVADESIYERIINDVFWPAVLFGPGLFALVLTAYLGPWPTIFLIGSAFYLWGKKT